MANLSPAAAGLEPLAQLQRVDRRELLRRAMLNVRPALWEAVLLLDLQELTCVELAAWQAPWPAG